MKELSLNTILLYSFEEVHQMIKSWLDNSPRTIPTRGFSMDIVNHDFSRRYPGQFPSRTINSQSWQLPIRYFPHGSRYISSAVFVGWSVVIMQNLQFIAFFTGLFQTCRFLLLLIKFHSISFAEVKPWWRLDKVQLISIKFSVGPFPFCIFRTYYTMSSHCSHIWVHIYIMVHTLKTNL